MMNMRIGLLNEPTPQPGGVVGVLPNSFRGEVGATVTEPFTEPLTDGEGVGTRVTGVEATAVGTGTPRSSLLHMSVVQHRQVQLCMKSPCPL